MSYGVIVSFVFQIMLCVATADSVPAGGASATAMTKEQVKLVGQFVDSMVRVEYYFQYDKGQPPRIDGLMERCPNCGNYHSIGGGRQFVDEERPLEIPGYVIAPDKILCSDIMVHPRFISKIIVVFKDHQVLAVPDRLFTQHYAVCLKLEKPLENAKPLELKADADTTNACYLINLNNASGQWCPVVTKFDLGGITVHPDGKGYYGNTTQGIVADKEGYPIGIVMNNRMSTDNAWKSPALQWNSLDSSQLQALFARIEDTANAAILRVKLNFRSPKSSGEQGFFSFDRQSMVDENATELNTLGVVIEPDKALIPLSLSPQQTARLERITFYDKTGQPAAAEFAGNMEDYGAMICILEKPFVPVTLTTQSLLTFRDKILTAVEVTVLGDERIQYIRHRRISEIGVGWKRKLFALLDADVMMDEGQSAFLFLFDSDGKLVTLPLERRRKIQDDENRWFDSKKLLFAANEMAPVLEDLTSTYDKNNVPLSEEEENRIAWLGVELQELDPELARINGVSEWTKNGQMGALISYVYPGSPAEQGGVQMGDVVIRLHVSDRPKPVDVVLEDSYSMYGLDELFQHLDQVPAEYLSQLPPPWPSMDNAFNRTLTSIGFGKTYRAEFARDGRLFEKEFKVVESPMYYDSAPRIKTDSLGMTVRNLTFEVRRFLQLSPMDPGIVVSKLEPGQKAFVAGIRPFEVITHINEEPVMNIEDFKRLIQQTELKITLKRMTQGRVVRIQHTPKPTSDDGFEGAEDTEKEVL